MRRSLTTFCIAVALAQSPTFEAASVKPAAPGGRGGRTTASGDRYTYANTTLSNVLIRAYGLKAYRVDGPSWIFTERYDILAKAPDNTPKEQIPPMLQALLTERFKLKLHRESREMQVYFLVTRKSMAKYQKSEGETGYSMDNGRVLKNHTMVQLADMLTFTVQRPVLDRTSLPGTYNIPLEMSQEELGKSDGSAPSIFTVVESIGLKLESRKAPVEILVVDSGYKTPTEN
ncbi:MAG TPA: TIGR03435 family protein [Bryobacteraceae bacterium]|nr:TIGR03435 family protein [Bryobacteraceae bacterium]